MEKLEEDINNLINESNQNWVRAIKEAEKSEKGLDLSEMFGKYSEIINKKDRAFQEAKIRKTGKKGGFF